MRTERARDQPGFRQHIVHHRESTGQLAQHADVLRSLPRKQHAEEKVFVVKSTIQSMLNRGVKDRKHVFW